MRTVKPPRRGRRNIGAMRPLLLATLVAATFPAAAGVFRCTTAGSVSYQEQPCDAASQGGAVAIPTQLPDYIEPRNRLAAREAAVDARILERLRIESAERIARDERAAREAQAQAERAQAQAAEAAWYPVYVGPVPRIRPLVRTHPRRQVLGHSQPLMR